MDGVQMNAEEYNQHLYFLGKPLPFRETLLRDPTQFLDTAVCDFYSGKHILITGFGTVGNKLLQMFSTLSPASLTFIDFSEQALHDLNLLSSTMNLSFPVYGLLLDLMRYPLLVYYLEPSKYDIVLHTAAYKNLPVVEDNIALPIQNNVIATNNLLRLFNGSSLRKFVYVSTDKAVYPKSIMGASKRMTEKVVLSHPEIDTAIVRLGNIFGSRGSLLEDMEYRAIKFGKIPVYTPDMERYFLSKREVAELIAFTGWQPLNGVTIIPDMQQPVNILSMVQGILNYVEDILPHPVVIESGKSRNGEKIKEALFYPEEEKVLQKFDRYSAFTLRHRIDNLDFFELEDRSTKNDVPYLISILKQYGDFVPDIKG